MTNSHNIKQPVLIVSTGRTGTKAIATYFDRLYESVTAYHEPKPSRRFRIISNLYLCNKISTETSAKVISHSRRRILSNISTPYYIESNPFMYGCLDGLKLIFPSIKIIHITRDPRTYIPSHINHGFYTGIKGLAGRHFPYWALKPDNYQPLSGLRWHNMNKLERLAWIWNTVNTEIGRRKEVFKENYLHLRFEDIFSDKADGLNKMAEWLGLPTNAESLTKQSSIKINQSRAQIFSATEKNRYMLDEAIRKFCHPTTTQYGYNTHPHQ